MKFIKCPKCKGEGVIENKICDKCKGIGIYSKYGGYFLYFKKTFKTGTIWSLRIAHFLKIIFKIILVIIGLIGMVFLIKILAGNLLILPEFIADLMNFIDYSQGFIIKIFWISVLTDMYFYYIIEKERDDAIKNWPKSSIDNKLELGSWEKIEKLSKRKKIDVLDSFNKDAKKIMRNSWKIAKKFKSDHVQPIHVFAAAIKDNQIQSAIIRLGIDREVLKNNLIKALSNSINSYNQKLHSMETKKVVLSAYKIAGEKQAIALTPLNLLQALVSFENKVKEIFYAQEITKEDIVNVCAWIAVYKRIRGKYSQFEQKAKLKPKGAMDRAYTAVATPYLDQYSHDLTQLAKQGYLQICMDRKDEINSMFRIFRSGAQDVILVGQAGVGKSTIINGLARRMVSEDVPEVIRDKRLVSLSLSSLVAGAGGSGQLENRLQKIINEIIRAGNIVLFIKDIHNMIGTKTAQGELDASEILASAMENRSFPVISTSNPKEYSRLLEGEALGDVFQKIDILEPDQNGTIQILELHAGFIEAKKEIFFSYPALKEAYSLSDQFLHDKFLPEKAINLLKEVASLVKTKRGKQAIVNSEDVAELISKRTKIPVTKITEKESKKLLNLEEQIHKRLINQNEAVNMVASSLRRARTELRSQDRPIVNLLFLGPTGVGKTELAKTVTKVYFGDKDRMIRMDMSEFQEKSTVSRFIGQEGSGTGGYLTEAVRKNPSSVLLLDEIEKAHPDILNIFLQVMDEGHLTDVLGRTIDFSNLIIIGTSNAGTSYIQDEIKKGTAVEKIQNELVQDKLGAYFRPEFINRFDGVVVFKPLSMANIKEIAKLMLKSLEKRLDKKGIKLEVTDKALDDIAHQGYDPKYGARPLRRVIQNKVDNILANYLLSGKLKRRDKVILKGGGKIDVEKSTGF